MGGRWRPWRALRERDDITFALADFPPGPVRALHISGDGNQLILIDRNLPPVDRLAALAHELVHVERGAIPHGAPAWLVTKEERHVEDETARRLVPLDQLEAWIRRQDLSEPITVDMVMAEWEVPHSVAERALKMAKRCALS